MVENINFIITDFIISHFIPMWLFFGFLTLLILLLLMSIIESENILELIVEDFSDLWKVVVSGPFGLIVLLYSLYLDRKDKREQKRKTCGWWELKEFGGKY